MSATFPAESAPADQDSTTSESTAPSTDSPEASDQDSVESPDVTLSEDEQAALANTTWGDDDPENPDYVAPSEDAPVEASASEEAE